MTRLLLLLSFSLIEIGCHRDAAIKETIVTFRSDQTREVIRTLTIPGEAYEFYTWMGPTGKIIVRERNEKYPINDGEIVEFRYVKETP